MSSIRLKDIAAVAGVDPGTVSHVLNRHVKSLSLRAETRERIERIARDLGYTRNEFAASISNRNSKIIAFVIDEMGSIEYTGRIQNGIFDAATSLGYAVILHHLDDRSTDEIYQKIMGWRPAGVIFHTASLSAVSELSTRFDEHSLPYGFVNLDNPGGLGITTDDRQGIFDAVKHFHNTNCKNIAYLSHPTKTKNTSEFTICREEAFKNAANNFYLDQEPNIFYLNGNLEINEERQKIKEILEQIQRNNIDALLCISDLAAFKVLQQAQTMNIKVPENLRIIGFGDLAIASICQPSLSTIAQDFEKMGKNITEQLIKNIKNKKKDKKEKKNFYIPVKLVLRESSPQN